MSSPTVLYRKEMQEAFLLRKEELTDKDLLCFLLSYAVDVEKAKLYTKKLFAQYSTLFGILHADILELINSGIPESAAMLIKMSVEQLHVKARESATKHTVFDHVEKVAPYFVKRFAGLPMERLYLMLLSDSYHFLGCISLGDGSINSTAFHNRALAENITKYRAKKVIVAHNHPVGLAIPSERDVFATADISGTCKLLSVTLLEHLVVAGNNWTPLILESDTLPLTAPHSFYDPDKLSAGLKKKTLTF